MTWTGYSFVDHPRLNVGLRLDRPKHRQPAYYWRNMRCIPPKISRDYGINGTRFTAAPRRDRKIHFAGLALVISGLALQLPEPNLYKILGWALWLLGSLAMVGKGIWIIWQQWVSR